MDMTSLNLAENEIAFPGLGIDGITVNSVAFSLFGIDIAWYGIIIAAGMTLAIIFGLSQMKKFGIEPDRATDVIIGGIIGGVIGARAYYVIMNWQDYAGDWKSIFQTRNGGLAIYGGIIGGVLGGCITAKILKQKIMPILDVAVLGFLIGQGIGRWGNFMNQEAYGSPTDLPWGMVSENTHMQAVHPCFLYESLWCLLGFVLIHFLSKKFQKYSGQVFYFYLVWYGFERMIVEGLRTDSLYLPFEVFGMPIRVSQVLSALILIFGIVMLIINRKKEDKFYDNYRRKKSVRRSKRASG